MKFERLQHLLTEGQFIARRHYCITSKVYNFARVAQFQVYKKDRKNCPTMADIYYQLIIEGLKHADKADFRKLPKNHTVRIKLGNPINTQLFELREKLECKTDIFSFAVCLMEAAIDNQ
jgi:hypothetical protein